MLEAILEFFGEFLLQLLLEALAELGAHWLYDAARKPPNRWLAAFAYALLGAGLGGLSLQIFPANFVPGPWRVANLVLTPIVAGLAMCLAGHWRARRGHAVLRIDRFAYGYLFALSLALVRYAYAH
jgi:hypothetical protein